MNTNIDTSYHHNFYNGDIKFSHMQNIVNVIENEDLQLIFYQSIVDVLQFINSNMDHYFKIPTDCFNDGVIYRVGKIPALFDEKYWPRGLMNNDVNELIFNSLKSHNAYLSTFKENDVGLKMCRRIKNEMSSTPFLIKNFLLNFSLTNYSDFTNQLNEGLIARLNKCVLLLLLVNNTFINDIPKEQVQKAVLEIFQGYPNLGNNINIRVLIANMGLYSRSTLYNGIVTLENVLDTWNHITNERNSHYIHDRLYCYHLGSILDIIEQCYNVFFNMKFNILGVYCASMKNKNSPIIFENECIIRKKFFKRDFRNKIFYTDSTTYYVTPNCNTIFRIFQNNINYEYTIIYGDTPLSMNDSEPMEIIGGGDKSNYKKVLKILSKPMSMKKFKENFLKKFKNEEFLTELYLFFAGFYDDKYVKIMKSIKNKKTRNTRKQKTEKEQINEKKLKNKKTKKMKDKEMKQREMKEKSNESDLIVTNLS